MLCLIPMDSATILQDFPSIIPIAAFLLLISFRAAQRCLFRDLWATKKTSIKRTKKKRKTPDISPAEPPAEPLPQFIATQYGVLLRVHREAQVYISHLSSSEEILLEVYVPNQCHGADNTAELERSMAQLNLNETETEVRKDKPNLLEAEVGLNQCTLWVNGEDGENKTKTTYQMTKEDAQMTKEGAMKTSAEETMKTPAEETMKAPTMEEGTTEMARPKDVNAAPIPHAQNTEPRRRRPGKNRHGLPAN